MSTIPHHMNTRLTGLAFVACLVVSGQAQAQLSSAAAAAQPDAVTGAPLVTMKEKLSYSTGVMTARTLKKNDVEFDVDILMQGMRDALEGGPLRMGEKELKMVLSSMQADITRKMSNDRQNKANTAREKGNIFQGEYKSKPGVVVLPGNLKIGRAHV